MAPENETSTLNGHDKTAEKEGKQSLSRHQRRQAERIENEANLVMSQLCGQFLNFFMQHPEPLGSEVKEQAKVYSAKWKMYCVRNGINPLAKDTLEKYCAQVIEQFKAELNREG